MGASCSLDALRDRLPPLPLSESCVACGRKPPRFLFFAISGALCNLAQLAIDRLLLALIAHGVLDLHDAWYVPTVCWTVSYTLSVALRHASHSFFVFGPSADPVGYALAKTYLTYLSTILASTAINLALVGPLGQTHNAALLATATFSVVWSYVALRYTWRSSSDASAGGDAPYGYHSVAAVDSDRSAFAAELQRSSSSGGGAGSSFDGCCCCCCGGGATTTFPSFALDDGRSSRGARSSGDRPSASSDGDADASPDGNAAVDDGDSIGDGESSIGSPGGGGTACGLPLTPASTRAPRGPV